jgi:hypothetical protein
MATRRARIVLVSGLVLALADRARASPSCRPPSATESATPTYVGVAACASQNCHGSTTPRGLSKTSLQNEYMTWYQLDRHARAYAMLDGDVGRRIGARLGLKPQESKRCLACHALEAADDRTSSRARVVDGVTCEACHGPAGGWLGAHTERDWDPACSIERGMRDTSRPEVVVETCLDCHLGDATRRVDHELLAAGHPPLAFELDTFATNMPAHWARRGGEGGNEAWFDGRAWAAGQVVAVRRAALQFAQQVHERGWPDFAAYDCQACHHEISGGTWAPRGTGGRPPLDGARRPGVDALVTVVAPERRAATSASADRLAAAAAAGRTGPDVEGAIGTVRREADGLLATVRTTALDDARLVQLMRAIVALGKETAGLGFRASQQAAWALESLVDARSELHGDLERTRYPRVRAAIGRVYDGLKDPSRYEPARTAQSIVAVGTVLE